MPDLNRKLYSREIEFEGPDGQLCREVQEIRLSDVAVIVFILVLAYLYRGEFLP